MAKKQSPQTADYEGIGQMFQSIVETGYANKKRLVGLSFVKGLAAGAGGVLGATLLIALLLWVLGLFENVPLVSPFVQKVTHTIEQGKNTGP
jgi:chromate transport protein ChrA